MIDLQLDTPAECAAKLLNGEVDLGLVPVAIIPKLSDPHIVTDTCIGADGAVETVCLFSEVPLADIEEILLDYQSQTSVKLVQLLAREHWMISPKWTAGKKDFIDRIGGTTAGVVIGDRAFRLTKKFPVVIDLSAHWKAQTGLPFVFACWVSNKKLSDDFIGSFQEAIDFGLANKRKAVESMTGNGSELLVRYVENTISYQLDDKKQQAMKLFIDWLSKSV
jgi:chorismate dehydratase